MEKNKKGYTKQAKQSNAGEEVTLRLKSKAKYNGRITLSTGERLKFREGKMTISQAKAKQLQKENKDFEEVK